MQMKGLRGDGPDPPGSAGRQSDCLGLLSSGLLVSGGEGRDSPRKAWALADMSGFKQLLLKQFHEPFVEITLEQAAIHPFMER